MLLNEFFNKKIITEGGNLASHTAAGTPTVGWTGVPGNYSAGKIDSKNRAAMQPAVKQLLVDINNLFTRQYGRPIWSPELIEKEVETFISGSSKWFMQLRQPNPNFNPQQPVSDANPKEIGVADKDFQRVKKKVGDIDTQIDRRLEPQIEEFIHKNIGANIGSATLLGTKKGSDQWLALWQLHEPPITLQVDLEFVDYTTDARGFEIPTEWAQVSHGSAWEDLEAGIKGVFRQWLYRSLAKVAPTEKYIARMAGAGKNKGIKLFGGDDGKELVADIDSPPPPLHDANFSFAVASVGGGGVRAKYRQPTAEENVPLEINGIPVMVPLTTAESEYIKDMGSQFEQFFGQPATGDQTKMMASFVGSVELMKQYFTPEQHQIVVNEFLKINFGKGAQMIDADDPTSDFKTKMTAVDYLLDQTGMKTMRKQVLQMAKEYEAAYHTKKAPEPLAEAEVKAQLRKGMPHLRDLKAPDFLDLLDEISDGNGRFRLQNIPLNVKVDGFGGRFGKNADGKPFMGTSRTEPRYQAGFVAYHKQKGTTDPDVLGRAQLFDQLFNEMMNAVQLVDSKLGPDFLVNKQVTCEVLYLPFATETPEGKLKFVGIHYDKLPEGVQLALVPFRVTDADTGEDLEDSNKFIKQLLSVGSSGSVMFIDNSLTQKEGLDVTELINPLDNIEQLKQIVSDTAGKRDRISQQLKREIEEKLQPIKLSLEKAIIEDPNIIGKDILGKDYEGIVINSRLGPIKVTSQEQRDVISAKQAAKTSARTERPRGETKTAVVAIGSFVGHKGHQELWNYTVNKAKELGGDPYLFIGNAEGKDDPIPPSVKVQTWHKLYPQYASNMSTVTHDGGTLIQKIKHELINPLPGKPPRYDNIVIMVGEDRAGLNMPAALMKAVNKFQGYEHVKVSLEVTPRGTGISGTMLRNSLKNDSPEKALAVWSNAFDVNKLGVDWIKHLMDITRKGMGIVAKAPAPVVEQRLFNALIKFGLAESLNEMNSSLNEFDYARHVKLLNAHMQKLGYENIGAGTDAQVFAKETGPVKKILMPESGDISTAENSFLAFYNYCQENARNPHLPKFQQIQDNIELDGEKFRQITMERLEEVDPEYEDMLVSMTDGIEDGKPLDPQYQPYIKFYQTLKSVMLTGRKLGFENDIITFQSCNIMQRGNTLVIADPWIGGGVEESELEEGPSLPSTLKSIVTNGEPITQLYGKLKAMAKRWVDNNGSLKGFHRNAAGQSAQWFNNFYFNKLQAELYALTKQAPKYAPPLIDFLKDASEDRERHINFTEISRSLPPILFQIGKRMGDQNLTQFASNWNSRREEYESYLADLEDQADGEDDFNEPVVKPEKSKMPGQQMAQVEQIVNDILAKLPKNIAGEIRNAIARSPNKLQALDQELTKRKIQAVEEARMSAATKLQRAWDRQREKSQASRDRFKRELDAAMPPPKAQEPEKKPEQGVAEGQTADMRAFFAGMDSDKSVPNVQRSVSPEEIKKLMSRLLATGERSLTPAQLELLRNYKLGQKVYTRKAEIENMSEKMMPASNFAGSKKNKLGPAGQWKNTGPSKNRPARAGDLVGGDSIQHHDKPIEEKIKGADGKACWKGKRYAGTKNGKDICIPVSEDVENIMDALINKIIVNEAIQNNRK